MRAVMQLGYRIRRFLLRRLRIRTRGVKVMLFNPAGELLLIRNSYGNRTVFVLPGGGIGRGESPEGAAVREVREEVGLKIGELAHVSTHVSAAEGKRDTIHLFRAVAEGRPRPDKVEVEEARFFSLHDLPGTVSEATRRRIDELTGARRPDGSW